jgi:hypothetical protein
MTPPVVELGRGIPGWLLRAALLLAAAGSVVAVSGAVPVTVVLVILSALALVTVAVPASPAPAVLITAVAIAVLVAGGAPLRTVVLVEIPLLHLVHVLAALSALLPLRSVLRPSALVRPALRFVVVQVAVFVVVGLTEILPTGRNTSIVELVGLIAVTGVVVLAVSALTRAK